MIEEMQQRVTLGKLRAHGYGLFGWCPACHARHRRGAAPGENPPASFDIDMATLIAERGADCAVVGLAPVACPRCGARQTETRLLPPDRAA